MLLLVTMLPGSLSIVFGGDMLAHMFCAFAMHRIRSSRFTRVMMLFAWFMLATASMPATASGMGESAVPQAMSMTMTSMMAQDTLHASSVTDHHDGCCGHAFHPACQCDAMCGSMLLPVIPALPGSAISAIHYAPMCGIDTPTIDPAPPLRPPAA
jgi:hypothetical protein